MITAIDKAIRKGDYGELERLRIEALGRSNAPDYYRACTELGIQPEDQFLFEMGAGEVEFKKKTSKRILKEHQIRLYQRFLEQADYELSFKPGAVFRETDKKRKLLEILDYTHLTGRNGERIPIDDCSDARIGRAFRNMYRTAQRFLQSQ